MAAGDVTSNIASVANNAYLDLQPAAGVEWCIHNISYAGAVEIYFYDGSNLLKVDSDTTFGGRFCMLYHCTNAKYYRVKNVSGSAMLISYDGVVTK